MILVSGCLPLKATGVDSDHFMTMLLAQAREVLSCGRPEVRSTKERVRSPRNGMCGIAGP